jgi:hypothetical protein
VLCFVRKAVKLRDLTEAKGVRVGVVSPTLLPQARGPRPR